MRDAIKSSREGGRRVDGITRIQVRCVASTLAFRTFGLFRMAAPQRRDLPLLEEGFYFFFFPTSLRSYGGSFLSCRAAFRLACAVICATERVGYLIKIGLFSGILVHALPERTLSHLSLCRILTVASYRFGFGIHRRLA